MRVGICYEGPRANYTEDILTAGIFSVLGRVGVWPYKPHFGGEQPEHAPEGSCWTPRTPSALFPKALGDLDLLVIGNPNSAEHLEAAEQAIAQAQARGIRIVAVDGDDRPNLDKLEALLPDGPWYVRECLPEMLVDARVRPLPFAVNTAAAPVRKPWAERNVDVLWGGSLGYGGREPYVSALEQLRGKFNVVSVAGRNLNLADWNAVLTRTKICVCLRGAGRMTYRYFEAPMAGAFPLVQPHGLVVPDDIPDICKREFTSPEAMLDSIRNLLDQIEHLRHLADEAHEHAWNSHSMTARAVQFLTSAMKLEGERSK